MLQIRFIHYKALSYNGILYAFGGKVGGSEVNEKVYKLAGEETEWQELEGASVITDQPTGFRVFFPAVKILKDKLFCE